MEPEFHEGPREVGKAQGGLERPSARQLLLALALFVGLFAVTFSAVMLFGSGGAAQLHEESAAESGGGHEALIEDADPPIQENHESIPDGEDVPFEPGSGVHPVGAPDDGGPVVDEAIDAFDEKDAPLLALVIDDWGYGWEAAADFLSLEIPLNVAVIPHLPFSVEHAKVAAGNGHQVILHMPMEPHNAAWDLGEGAITTLMTDSEIAFEVRRAFDSIPHISGINNHMGSKATENKRVVRAVLEVVKERGAFFLDSRTSPNSLVDEVAVELGVPYLENDRFIDVELNAARVRDAILLAADTARRRGWAIAIGHVHRATYQGLVAALPGLREKGVRLAYLRDILDQVDPGWNTRSSNSLP